MHFISTTSYTDKSRYCDITCTLYLLLVIQTSQGILILHVLYINYQLYRQVKVLWYYMYFISTTSYTNNSRYCDITCTLSAGFPASNYFEVVLSQSMESSKWKGRSLTLHLLVWSCTYFEGWKQPLRIPAECVRVLGVWRPYLLLCFYAYKTLMLF